MKSLALVPISMLLGVVVMTSCGSDSDQQAKNVAVGGAGGAAAGRAGASSTETGGSISTAGNAEFGGSAGSDLPAGGVGGATNAGGMGGTENGGASGAGSPSVGGAAGGSGGPNFAELTCKEDDECTAACQAYGWPEGRCNGVTERYCYCVSKEEPTCTKGTTTGCPPGTACRFPTQCMPVGDGVDGDPCPNGNECQVGYICVGYGNPLPNGARTACRQMCEVSSQGCKCSGGGYCEGGSGGSSAAGGAGGTGGAANCSELIVNPGCEDAFDNTKDFQSKTFGGCMHWRDLGENKGWIWYDGYGGFHYDLETGLGWIIRTSTGTLTHAEAATFCDGFTISGLDNWRLPTINETRTLAAGCPDTAPSGTCPLEDATCLNASCGTGEECTSCTYKAGGYCRPEAFNCGGFHTSSACADCSTPGYWRYGAGNGNFYSAAADNKTFPVCVMDNIPNAVPCK